MARIAHILITSLAAVDAAVLREASNSTDPTEPGSHVWLVFSVCPGQPDPVGTDSVPVLVADPFALDGFAGILAPMHSQYMASDGKNLNRLGQDFYCDATVWTQPPPVGVAPPGYNISGRWVFQTSFPWNLCGAGYGTGPWRGERSAYMKTLISLGPVGVTLFFNTVPTKYAAFPETCGGVSDTPITISSIGQYQPLVLRIFNQPDQWTISIDEKEKGARDLLLAAYAVALVSAAISLLSVFVAFATLVKRGTKSCLSFPTMILTYEGLAAITRAVLYIVAGPLSLGPYNYNGIDLHTDQYLSMVPSPLGVPTTF